jgi:hypothetical protein
VRLWTSATAAASGTPPTYATHVSGVPNQGSPIEAGLTENDCVFSYQLTKTEINGEQSLGPVDVYASDETMSLTFTMQESNAQALKVAFDASVGYDSTGGDGFYFGGGTAVLAPMTTCVFFSSVRRDNTAKYFVGQIYKAYSKDGMKFAFSKTKKGMFQVTLIALADLTRTAKDQMGYFRRET